MSDAEEAEEDDDELVRELNRSSSANPPEGGSAELGGRDGSVVGGSAAPDADEDSDVASLVDRELNGAAEAEEEEEDCIDDEAFPAPEGISNGLIAGITGKRLLLSETCPNVSSKESSGAVEERDGVSAFGERSMGAVEELNEEAFRRD